MGSLSTTGPSQPISTGCGRKVILTGLTARVHHLQSMWWLFPQARSQPRQDQSQFQRGSLTAALCSLTQQAALSSSLPAAPGELGGALSTGSSRPGVSNIPLPQLHPGILPTPHSRGHCRKNPSPPLQSISAQCLRNCGKRKEWAAGRAQPPPIPGWAGHTSIQRPLYMPE